MSIADDVREAAKSLSSAPEPSGTTGTTPEPAVAATKAVPEPTGTSGTATGRDAQGRFAPKQGDKPAENAPPVPSKSATEGAPAPPKRGPPKSFRPTVHGHWEKVPTEVQEEVLRVEAATQELAKRFSQANNTHKQFNDFLSGYRPYIQGDPFQWLDSLAKTAVRLQTAPSRDKGIIIAQMAKQFGVDVDTLDDALTEVLHGQGAQAGQRSQPEADNPLMTRIQELEQRLSHMSLAPMLEAFTKEAEFLDEPIPGRDDLKVRDMVAHHLRTAAQAHLALTPQEAYAQVIATHPTIQAVLKQREEAKAAAAQQQSTARAEAASRSVRTEHVVASPSTGSKGRTIDDVRATAQMLRSRS
jgi:hypothetical protein